MISIALHAVTTDDKAKSSSKSKRRANPAYPLRDGHEKAKAVLGRARQTMHRALQKVAARSLRVGVQHKDRLWFIGHVAWQVIGWRETVVVRTLRQAQGERIFYASPSTPQGKRVLLRANDGGAGGVELRVSAG